MPLTVGQIIVNDCLPPEFRDYERVLDSKGLEALLQRVAHEKPELYSEITKKLMDVGNDAAFDEGVTLRLSDCETGFDKTPYLRIVADAEDKIENDPSLSPAEKSKALGEVYGKVQSSIEKGVFDTELKKRNQLALQVASKARGTPGQLASFVSTPGSFPDSNGNTVPMFIQHSYAEGLTPAEYWAGSYGTRTSVVQGKIATAKGGAFGKLLSQSANNQVVVEDDCGGVNGVPMPLDDDDNLGAVLANDAGKYKAGTVITKSVLADLRKDKKLDEIVVRSPMTCGCKSGVCAKCAGIRETGGFPPIGYNLGTNAASAFAERITQGALNTKHTGRLASGAGTYQGFGMFTSMAKVPKSYPDKATLADVDGEVTEIKDAPQGGKYVVIDDGSAKKEHYVPTGYAVLVKPGDKLEAGDQLSDGVINPAELVGYKGIGEARRYWAQRFTQGIRDSGMKGNRRNAEVLAKTLINDVELEEEDPAGLPGDVTTYNKWAFSFKPRPDTKVLKPDAARGMYLEQPVLHYTIGTRITPSVAKTLAKFGQKQVFANPNKPSVVPFMPRVEDSNAVRDDWIARLGTTYLKDRIVEDAQRGAESHLHTTEPNPSLAKGVEFGTWGQPGSKNKSRQFTY
jgi:DNA-directed RNA polymerase subunit beta'